MEDEVDAIFLLFNKRTSNVFIPVENPPPRAGLTHSQPLTQLILQQSQDVNVARIVGQPTGVHAAAAAHAATTASVVVATGGAVAIATTEAAASAEAIAIAGAPVAATAATTTGWSIVVVICNGIGHDLSQHFPF